MSKQNSSRSLIRGFLESAERFPDRTALVVDGESLTYSSLRRLAGRIASAIAENGHTRSPLVAVWAHRSQTAYAGILGSLDRKSTRLNSSHTVISYAVFCLKKKKKNKKATK